MADETVHAYQLVEIRDDGNQPTGEYKWTCTCGSEGKPTDDEAGVYDAWIKHQQRTFDGNDGSVGEEPAPGIEPTPVTDPAAGTDDTPPPDAPDEQPRKTTGAKKTPAKRTRKSS